jgi:hypothetical protein
MHLDSMVFSNMILQVGEKHQKSKLSSKYLVDLNRRIFSLLSKQHTFLNLVQHTCLNLRLMVFNATFNNSSVISWWSVLLVEETIDLSQVTDKLYHTEQENIFIIVQTTYLSKSCSTYLFKSS